MKILRQNLPSLLQKSEGGGIFAVESSYTWWYGFSFIQVSLIMKKILFTLFFLFTCLFLRAQGVVVSETKEVVASASQLYGFTKMFVADTWTDANEVIVNADETAGIMQVKAITRLEVPQLFGVMGCVYDYSYAVKFRIKDNKYRIEVYDVNCIRAKQVGSGSSLDVPLIEYFDGEQPKGKTKSMGKGASKEEAKKMMDDLRSEFNGIISLYAKYIESSLVDDF